jgi:hypothetical protein
MRKITFYFTILISLIFILSCNKEEKKNNHSETTSIDHLKEQFYSPGPVYGVNCWWWWLNGNVTREAITRDLEAMRSRNFIGAMIFDAGGHNQRGNKHIPAGPLFGSEEWNKLFVFALDEAKRLNLEIGFNIQSGWNLGGPRVTPQYAAKQLTYSETIVKGGSKIEQTIALPKTHKDFYKDIALLAFPLKKDNYSKERISFLDYKLMYHELGGSAPDSRFLLDNKRLDKRNEGNSAYVVNKNDIINLSSKMNDQGALVWEVPPGNEWAVMRIGYTCTDAEVSTSSNDWQGNVLDYMSKEAFEFYWNDVVEPIFKAAGDHVGATLKYMETDSWECGGMNWSSGFPEEFKKFFGYDAIEYLPVIGGYIIDNIEVSNAFLSDFRKTISNMVSYNHYAEFARYAHKYNMGIQPESAGPHAGPLDGIKNYGFSDIVMSEFWSPSPHRPTPETRFFLKQASSAAHIYGKKIVGAESFTTIGPHWNDELWRDQKSSFDHEICAGLNRLYFHTFTCSPTEMRLPGQEYFAGTHVNPQVTWWEYSGAFIDYLNRVQSVVQNGVFVADVLYYYGDHVPNVFPFKHSDPAQVMPGFDYDVTNEDVLLKLKYEDGKITAPGGLVRYEALVLPDHKALSLEALIKIEKLLSQGANILGYKPEYLISLKGGAEAQSKFKEISDNIWGKDISERSEAKYKKGTVSWGVSAHDYLISKNLLPDFSVTNNNDSLFFDYIHYKLGDKDLYFVSNQTGNSQNIECSFRVSGKKPELWDALTGEIRDAGSFSQANDRTNIPLSFDPYGSILIVFNNEISKEEKSSQGNNYPVYSDLLTITGAWTVRFDTKWGGPESAVSFPELTDWSQSRDADIKYYSGAADYNKTFNIDFEPETNVSYYLELGSVKDVGIAVVKINGIDKGIVWTSPFRVDISRELKKGENQLDIKVINSWFNRVAGDEIAAAKKRLTSTNIVLINDFRGRKMDEIKLEPSGLLGPVKITKGQW